MPAHSTNSNSHHGPWLPADLSRQRFGEQFDEITEDWVEVASWFDLAPPSVPPWDDIYNDGRPMGATSAAGRG